MARGGGPPRLAKARAALAGRPLAQRARVALTRRAARWLRSQDPKVLEDLSEVGIVRRDWLEGAGAPVTDGEPMAVLTRSLEALVERRPSALSALGLSAIRILAGASGHEEVGTPRRLTVAFADLVGFTAFTEAQGDAAARDVLRRYYISAGRIVRSRRGRIVKRLGDGLLLTFAEPAAAALAALELVEDSPVGLQVRTGIHTGDVLVEADDVAGHTVNVASRVADVAGGGEVLVTAPVAAELPADDARFEIRPAHTAQLRGVSEPLTLHRVVRRR